jgi:hypothetical protein
VAACTAELAQAVRWSSFFEATASRERTGVVPSVHQSQLLTQFVPHEGEEVLYFEEGHREALEREDWLSRVPGHPQMWGCSRLPAGYFSPLQSASAAAQPALLSPGLGGGAVVRCVVRAVRFFRGGPATTHPDRAIERGETAAKNSTPAPAKNAKHVAPFVQIDLEVSFIGLALSLSIMHLHRTVLFCSLKNLHSYALNHPSF